MISIIKEGSIFSPEPLGTKDVLVIDRKIGAITPPGKISITGTDVEFIAAGGKYVVPGFIDSHVHILGGGGEGGPSTRAPEIRIEDITSSGVTSLIGCLGTDGTTRHMESLLAKARALEIEGMDTWLFSGSYEIPVQTLTGSVRTDLILIDKIIGAGEIAVSDHRSSQPTFEEFSRLAAECRVGGMLGGKAGILHCHMGDGPRGLEMLFRLAQETEIPITQVIPTHINRNSNLMAEGLRFIEKGGWIDVTADENPEPEEGEHMSVAQVIRLCLKNGAPLDHLTISSDGNGSLPAFDDKGNLRGLRIATQKSLLTNFRYLVQKNILRPEQALMPFTSTPAAFYKLAGKGEIKPGNDADLLLMDAEWNLTDVFSRGGRMMADSRLLARGTFSK